MAESRSGQQQPRLSYAGSFDSPFPTPDSRHFSYSLCRVISPLKLSTVTRASPLPMVAFSERPGPSCDSDTDPKSLRIRPLKVSAASRADASTGRLMVTSPLMVSASTRPLLPGLPRNEMSPDTELAENSR